MVDWLRRAKFSSAYVLFLCAVAVILSPFGISGTAFAQDQSIMGTWALVWEGARDNYTGTLQVTTKVNDKLFKARLNLLKSNGAAITEAASITVSGDEVRIECSDPSVKNWNPDRFYVVRNGNRMEGYSLDSAGQRGQKIVFNKR
ncbi:MAG TPA: hypothetical protein VG056_03530 [Pirellulales bacterium]|jgi:hypothetical protein|nr:hypothetical protein [Pirellulales bacterium]